MLPFNDLSILHNTLARVNKLDQISPFIGVQLKQSQALLSRPTALKNYPKPSST